MRNNICCVFTCALAFVAIVLKSQTANLVDYFANCAHRLRPHIPNEIDMVSGVCRRGICTNSDLGVDLNRWHADDFHLSSEHQFIGSFINHSGSFFIWISFFNLLLSFDVLSAWRAFIYIIHTSMVAEAIMCIDKTQCRQFRYRKARPELLLSFRVHFVHANAAKINQTA